MSEQKITITNGKLNVPDSPVIPLSKVMERVWIFGLPLNWSSMQQ